MKTWIVCLTIIAAHVALSSTEPLPRPLNEWFYGPDSIRALLEYRTYVRVPTSLLKDSVKPSDGSVRLSRRDLKSVKSIVAKQVQHLFGVFTYHTHPIDFSTHPGTIRNESEPKITRIVIKKGYLEVFYRYSDHAIFHRDLFPGGAPRRIRFYLPTSPTEIYKLGFPKKPVLHPETKKPMNLCTSEYDNSELAFWYYWNPFAEHCPKAIFKGLHWVGAHVKPMPSTERTYPEYQRLYTEHSLRGNNMVYFNLVFGVDAKFDDPKDLGRLTFEQTAYYFKNLAKADGTALMEERSGGSHYRVFVYPTDQFRAIINLTFIDPDADNEAWARFVISKLRHSSVFVYAGHSYDGREIDLESLLTIDAAPLPKSRYQIIQFDSCTSYPYFHSSFFELKAGAHDPQGTLGLDILTNAVGSPFLVDNAHTQTPTPQNILVNMLVGLRPDGTPALALPSWQEIVETMSHAFDETDTPLLNVLGDEDNPTELDPEWPVPRPQ